MTTKLIPHDGVTEWSVCGRCHARIDWANDVTAGRDRDDTSCPHCGHADTAYLEADDDDGGDLVCGNQVQHDNSGVGHNWRDIAASDIPANIIEEIEGEMIDGKKDECEDFVGSNGLHYRW
jgi:hypothetical protein